MADVTEHVLFLVPARGGSERIPGKNLRPVGGIPLVARAVRLALAAAADLPGGPHAIVCSTDDPAIAAAARAAGAEVLDRPAELATATAASVDVALHALDARAEPVGTLVLLQPTSPLTEPADVLGAIATFERTGRRGVASIAHTHPARFHVALGDHPPGSLEPFMVGDEPAAEATAVLTGAIYVADPATLRATRRFVEPGTMGYVVPAERSVDVDEPADLTLADALARASAAPRRAMPAGEGPAGEAGESPAPAPAAGHPRTIAILTTGRQDWGIVRSTAVAIRAHSDLRLRLIVGGMHVSPRRGSTIEAIRADGFEPDAVLEWLGTGADDPQADEQAGAALTAIGDELRRHPVDALVLAGDRFETAAAAVAATVNRVPIVHLHGGEQTFGAFDDALRHAITKLAHLHLVSHPEHAARVIALGEDPATVHVVGTPGLDALARPDLPDRSALEADLGLALEPPVVVVTVHPTTLDADPAAAGRAVVAAMDRVEATYVITLPNVDPGSAEVMALLEEAARRPRRVAVRALGERRYWGLLRIADAMLGNSSSGIAEAPAVALPVVNVGDRQAGRRRHPNVVDVPAEPATVAAALERVLDPAFRATLGAPDLPLADGRVGERIAHIIAGWHPPIPPRKAPIEIPS